MNNNTTIPFVNPAFRDELTDLVRAHAQTAIRQSTAAELEAFLSDYDDTDVRGHRNVVRKGYQGFRWNHKRVYRIHCELELNLLIKPKRRIVRELPKPLAVPAEINGSWAMVFIHGRDGV